MVSCSPPRVQQALGEDVPPPRIGAELNLVDGQKLHRRGSSGMASTVQTK